MTISNRQPQNSIKTDYYCLAHVDKNIIYNFITMKKLGNLLILLAVITIAFWVSLTKTTNCKEYDIECIKIQYDILESRSICTLFDIWLQDVVIYNITVNY